MNREQVAAAYIPSGRCAPWACVQHCQCAYWLVYSPANMLMACLAHAYLKGIKPGYAVLMVCLANAYLKGIKPGHAVLMVCLANAYLKGTKPGHAVLMVCLANATLGQGLKVRHCMDTKENHRI